MLSIGHFGSSIGRNSNSIGRFRNSIGQNRDSYVQPRDPIGIYLTLMDNPHVHGKNHPYSCIAGCALARFIGWYQPSLFRCTCYLLNKKAVTNTQTENR